MCGRALPFVDWADIYGASGQARIHVNSAIAMHAVFTARVVIDAPSYVHVPYRLGTNLVRTVVCAGKVVVADGRPVGR